MEVEKDSDYYIKAVSYLEKKYSNLKKENQNLIVKKS